VQIAYTIDGEVASTFPEKGNYTVTVDCGDTATAEWDSDKWGLFISSANAEKIKCNISFESPQTLTLADYIISLADDDTINLAYDDTDDENLRYIGADPSNYICFDTTCSNGKWRIIGVMNNIETKSNGTQSLVKIIRADSVGNYAWNSNFTNDWDTSSLKDELNAGSLYETYIEDYNELFESVVWKLGGSPDYEGVYTKDFYTYERGTLTGNSNAYAATWTGKIGLMYPSDYGYATSGGDTGRDACLNIDLYNWDGDSNCYENDYLFDSSNWQWTLTPFSSDSFWVFGVHDTGYVRINDSVDSSDYAVRPVGYLISDLIILDGDGSNGNPWILGE
jgi:hypothetical protein